MMTPLKRGSVTGQALSPIYLYKVSDNCAESRLFGSVVRALVFYRGDPGITSNGKGNFSATLLCYGYHVVRWGLTSEIGPLFRL